MKRNSPLIENISSWSENQPIRPAGVDPQACGWYRAAGADSGDWSLPWGGGQSLSLSGREAHAEEHSHVHEAWHHLRVSHLWHLPLHERVQWRWSGCWASLMQPFFGCVLLADKGQREGDWVEPHWLMHIVLLSQGRVLLCCCAPWSPCRVSPPWGSWGQPDAKKDPGSWRTRSFATDHQNCVRL